MKKNTTLHEIQNLPHLANLNPYAGIREPEPAKEEDIVWLTPEAFMEEVKVLLRKKFEERAGKIQ